jgi:hypothetical protein
VDRYDAPAGADEIERLEEFVRLFSEVLRSASQALTHSICAVRLLVCLRTAEAKCQMPSAKC